MKRGFPGWREAWCPKCNGHRVATKAGRCIQCGDKLQKEKQGVGGWRAEKTEGAYSGKVRDSKQEAAREPVLQALANAGRITELDLKPGMYSLEVYGTQAVDALLTELKETWLDHSDLVKEAVEDVERSRQRIGGYTPDFQYHDHTGALVVEDVKGRHGRDSKDFPLRKKLMVACHNVEVQVIREQRGVQQWARGAGAKGKGTGSRLRGARG